MDANSTFSVVQWNRKSVRRFPEGKRRPVFAPRASVGLQFRYLPISEVDPNRWTGWQLN